MRTRILAVAVVLVCVSLGSADLVTPRNQVQQTGIPGLATRATIERFKVNEPAAVMVSGNSATCLGLYVFNAHGNCVAKDDRVSPQSSDDLAVEFIPSDIAPYSIEVRNGGFAVNVYSIAVR